LAIINQLKTWYVIAPLPSYRSFAVGAAGILLPYKSILQLNYGLKYSSSVAPFIILTE